MAAAAAGGAHPPAGGSPATEGPPQRPADATADPPDLAPTAAGPASVAGFAPWTPQVAGLCWQTTAAAVWGARSSTAWSPDLPDQASLGVCCVQQDLSHRHAQQAASRGLAKICWLPDWRHLLWDARQAGVVLMAQQ